MTGLDYLTDAYNVVNEHRSETPEKQVEIMREYMKKFFYENIVCSASKFDMYKFVSNDKQRDALCCVLHDKGFKVASDGYALAVIPDSYPGEYEGKMLAKDGTEVEGRYPNYRACIPNYTDDNDTSFSLDAQRLKEAFRKAKAERRLEGKDAAICINIEGVYFRDCVFSKLVMFFNAFPKTKMFMCGKKAEDRVSRAVTLRHGETIGLFMPCFPPEDEDETIVINY